jgi:4-diphosphocytidyl-2-C-methyl-D-erythritol kinase
VPPKSSRPPPDPRADQPAPVTVRAPAKLNLHLSVGPLRDDGYHDLTTVYQAVSLYDEVTATPANALSVSAHGEDAALVPLDGGNLALRAAVALAQAAGIDPLVRLDIVKAIPVAGGLAGGSADAAAALVACDALWATAMDRDALLDIAAGLGSDVPFALTGGTALGTGRGERLAPVLAIGRWHWVLAVAESGLSTPDVYRELDRRRQRDVMLATEPLDALINALRSGQPASLGDALSNDLQVAALSLRPALRRTLDAGEDLGSTGRLVSGSGPTCAFLASSGDDAVRLAAALAGAGVCRTVRTAYGPVVGARVVPAADR